jgi:membrane dipeptidase
MHGDMKTAAPGGTAPSTDTTSRRARGLVAGSLVVDAHGCMPLRPLDESFLPQLERYRDARVDAVFLNVGFGEQGIEEHIRMLAQFRDWLARNDGRFALATSVAAVDRARRDGKLAVGFDIEGMNAVADQPSLVRLYYDLGVRWMLIAYNRNNAAGGGCQDEDEGLTPLGRRMIEEMAQVGMLLCCSHAGEKTARDAIDHSPNPVIFSHSNCHALWPHPRNIADHVMKACAARGGLICLTGIGAFLGANDARPRRLAEHVDHAVRIAGAQSVGIGLDFVFDEAELHDYVAAMPSTFPPHLYPDGMRMVAPEKLPELVEELCRMGYSDEDISGILGGNFMRVAGQVWR